MRLKFDRAFYIPPGSMAVRAKGCDAVVYVREIAGKPQAVGFAGKAQKPAFNYSYRDAARREAHVRKFFEACERNEAARVDRRAKAKAFVHSLKVGDVLNNSWGYDQTNIEFFEVVQLVGKSMVIIRELAQQHEQSGLDSWGCVPVAGKYVGKPLRKRVLEGNSLDIHNASFGRAHLYERKEVAPGLKVGAVLHASNGH